MAYRANVTDKQQGDVESVADGSACRFHWFNGVGTGVTKAIRANDLQQQRTSTFLAPATNDMKQLGHIIASHNDKPATFETPGKA